MSAHPTDPPGAGNPAQRRALRIALLLGAGFMVVEALGGVLTGSLALLADAGHMLTDVLAISIALVAFRLAALPASSKHSYGLQRVELIAALVNAVGLLVVAGWIAIEAVQRLQQPPEVEGAGLLAIATVGLAVNIAAAAVVARAHNGNLNLRAALLHLAADALGSAGAIVAGLAVILFGATWVDAAVSLLIAVLIVVSVGRLLRDVGHMLLEGTPPGLDPSEVAAALHSFDEVDRVHHVHVWRLSSDSVALSAHVVAHSVETLHAAQLLADQLKAMLAERFGIDHATLELECHDCRGQHMVPASDVVSRRRS